MPIIDMLYCVVEPSYRIFVVFSAPLFLLLCATATKIFCRILCVSSSANIPLVGHICRMCALNTVPPLAEAKRYGDVTATWDIGLGSITP